jgi:hypothetical protein
MPFDADGPVKDRPSAPQPLPRMSLYYNSAPNPASREYLQDDRRRRSGRHTRRYLYCQRLLVIPSRHGRINPPEHFVRLLSWPKTSSDFVFGTRLPGMRGMMLQRRLNRSFSARRDVNRKWPGKGLLHGQAMPTRLCTAPGACQMNTEQYSARLKSLPPSACQVCVRSEFGQQCSTTTGTNYNTSGESSCLA